MEDLSWSDILNLIGTDREREALEYYAKALELDRHRMLRNVTITDAAMFAPTEHSKHDKQTKSAQLLANLLNVDMRNYRRLYISPLRKFYFKMEQL